MKKSTILATAALAGFGALLVAPAAVADPRISVPFVPVSVPFDPPSGNDGIVPLIA
jgi:hypothetical protein